MNTNFFDAQEEAKRKSRWILVMFVFFTLGFSYLSGLIATYVGWVLLHPESLVEASLSHLQVDNPSVRAVSDLIFSSNRASFITFESMKKFQHSFTLLLFVWLVLEAWVARSSLKKNGVGEYLINRGALRVSPQSADFYEKRFHNVAQEMSIASGIRVPELYVLPGDLSINAFAMGYTSHSSCIAMTEGALKCLTRAELQGVVAHEFSHVLNGDVFVKTDLMGLLSGYNVISAIGSSIQKGFGGTSGGNSGIGFFFVLGLVLNIFGSVGVIASSLFKALFSRQREWLADASAVQFTRNPSGLRGALEKIDANVYRRVSGLERKIDFSHMFFVSGVSSWAELFASHPPIEQRIRALGKPNYTSPEQTKLIKPVDVDQAVVGLGIDAQYSPMPSESKNLNSLSDTSVARSDKLRMPAKRKYSMPEEALQSAVGLVSQLPAELRADCDSPLKAKAICYSIIVSQSSGDVQVVMKRLRDDGILEQGLLDTVRSKYLPALGPLSFHETLVLMELACEMVRSLPKNQVHSIVRNAFSIFRMDGTVSLREICFLILLCSRILRSEEMQKIGSTDSEAGAEPTNDITQLLGYIAHLASASSPGELQRSFSRALNEMGFADRALPAASSIQVTQIIRAVGFIRSGSSSLRRRFVAALSECAASEERMSENEKQIVRTISSAVSFPVSFERSPAERS